MAGPPGLPEPRGIARTRCWARAPVLVTLADADDPGRDRHLVLGASREGRQGVQAVGRQRDVRAHPGADPQVERLIRGHDLRRQDRAPVLERRDHVLVGRCEHALLTVGEVMHPCDRIACAQATDTLREVVIRMTEYPFGAACVVDADGNLLGILTDGDVRRLLSKSDDILSVPIRECMTRDPLATHPERLLGEAVRLMEERQSQVSVLPVVRTNTRELIGLIRLHDAYQPNLA